MSRIYAIDANGLGHWLYHAGDKERLNEAGEPCGMLDGVREWLLAFLAQYEPTHIAALFDGRNNFRKQISVEYKTTRLTKPLEPQIVAQLPKLRGEFEALGLPCLVADTFEADDLAATLAGQYGAEHEIVLITSDKDWAQLVTDNVKIYNPRPNKAGACLFYGPAEVEASYGVPPHRVTEWLALMGDATDDVPGVEGWGKTRAINAVRQTKSKSELLRKAAAGALEHIPAGIQAKLASAEGLAAFDLSLRLVELRYDVPIAATLADLEWHHPQTVAA